MLFRRWPGPPLPWRKGPKFGSLKQRRFREPWRLRRSWCAGCPEGEVFPIASLRGCGRWVFFSAEAEEFPADEAMDGEFRVGWITVPFEFHGCRFGDGAAFLGSAPVDDGEGSADFGIHLDVDASGVPRVCRILWKGIRLSMD